MPTARSGLAATNLDGLVYAIGGTYAIAQIFGIGAVGVDAVEAYDPATNTWATRAPLPIPRVYPNGATTIDRHIYLPGGAGCDAPGCGETNTLLVFDPDAGPAGAWTAGPPMPRPIFGGTSGAIDGQLYVLAGWSVGAPRNFFYRFDPATSEWTELPGSPSGHTFAASTVLGGKFYATGGEGSTSALDIYDPATNSWTSKTMPVGYQHHGAVAIGDVLYLVGGDQFINGVCCVSNIVTAYDPQTDSWSTPAPVPAAGGPYAGDAGHPVNFSGSSTNTLSVLPSPLNIPSATNIGDALFVMGGHDDANTHVLPTLFSVNPPGTAALTYTWDFGDGQQGGGQNPAHVYAAAGTYTATVTVSTVDGRSATATAQVTIINTNHPPVANAGGPYLVLQNQPVLFDGTGSSDPDGDALGYEWDFDGDAIADATTAQAAHSFATAGTYTVSLTVRDPAGAINTAQAVVTVISPDHSTTVWLGLKNSDDVGTYFDLKVEVLKNGTVVGSGELDGVAGGSSGFNNAVSRVIGSVLSTAPTYATGDVLGIRLSARIAEGVSGHRSGTARLWYGDASATSRAETAVNGAIRTYYLRTGFSLSTTAGSGARSNVDVLVDRTVNGNAFKPFGTWSIVQ